jgi:hypothetical protein
MKLRAPIVVSALAISATIAAGFVPLSALGATAHAVSDPVADREPSSGFKAVCNKVLASPAESAACDQVAVPEFDAARAAEGVAPLVLPDNFDSLSVPAQLLTITDLERVDRGLPPIAGLSSRLSGLAQQGADAQTDPPFPEPFDGTSGQGNWAGFGSALLATYEWMYNDGPGGINLGCTPQNAGDCWGHRHTIVGDYDAPIVMGAAVSNAGGGSTTELIIGGDNTDAVDQTPTWATIETSLSFGLNPTSTSLTADKGSSKGLVVTATSGGGALDLTAAMQQGEPAWSVSPTSCHVGVGQSCQFTLTFTSPGPGHFPGILGVTDGLHTKTVAIAAIGITPQVALSVNSFQIKSGHILALHAVVSANPTNERLPGRQVVLQKRQGGSGWQTLATGKTGGQGRKTFHQHPTHTASYRLEVVSSGGAVLAKTGPLKVRVTR